MIQAPKAPTIADLLANQQVPEVTSAQEQARRAFAERMAAIQGTASLPQALSDVGGHIANAIMHRQDLARAQEADRMATEQASARRASVAEALAASGVAPEQAVSMATNAPQDNALVLELMGLNRQQQAADEDRAFREQQAAAEQARFDQEMGLRRDQFGAQQAAGAADRALRERPIAAAAQVKTPDAIQIVRESGFDPASPEGRDFLMRLKGGEAAAAEFGAVPSGMARVPDPNAEAGYRLVPLQGSEAQLEQAQAEQRALLGREQQMQDLDIMMRDLNRVMDISQAGGGGPIGGSSADIPIVGPATPAGQLRQHLEPIRTNVAFDRLQSMRESSPTGGALGSITERELSGLAASSGALNEFLPEEDLQRNVLDLGVKYINAAHGTDAQIDAAVSAGRITKEQAAEGKALRDQQIEQWQQRSQGPAAEGSVTPYADMTDDDLLKALGQ